MIYAGDQAIQLPVRDIYDTQIMLASINAARDMYERGQKQMEDFYKKYGDFFSPISSDMDWYDQNVTGRARDFIQNLYNNGVDPLRSAEGRALIQQFVNSVPISEVNKRKQAAAAAQEYIKARGELEAKGLWNPEYERYVLGGRSLEDWDTTRDGFWTRTAPSQYKTLQELTEDWYDKRTPHDLTQAEVEGFGMKYDPRYRYQGFTDDDLMNIARDRTPGWYGSSYANYYRDLARQKVVNAGLEPTEDNVERQLQRDIASSQQKWLVKPVADEDKFALRAQDHAYDVALENLRYSHSRSNGDGGRGNRTEMPSIFDEASQNKDVPIGYDIMSNPHYQWITPIVSARVIKGKGGNFGYEIPAAQIDKIYKVGKYSDNGTPYNARWDNILSGNTGNVKFIPDGTMVCRTDKDGNDTFWIQGSLADRNGKYIHTAYGAQDTYEIQVIENDHSYGIKQKTVTQPTRK